jgi:excisionase family DNA binding protein
MDDPRILYDRKTAAAALSISVRGLDYLIESGKLRVRRLGRRVLVPRSELERLARQDQAEIVPSETNDGR